MKSRLEGDLDDFIFIKSKKIILPIKKSEKTIRVRATSKRKAHKRRITFEGKEKKIESSHDFIESKLNFNIDMQKGKKYVKDSLMGEQVIIYDENKNRLDVWIKETPNMIQLSTIGAEKKGTGIGTKYLFGLKKYADHSGKKLVIPDMTPSGKKYFSQFDWLKDDHVKLEYEEGGEHREYYASNTMSYSPSQKNAGNESEIIEEPKTKPVEKSSLHPDNLKEIILPIKKSEKTIRVRATSKRVAHKRRIKVSDKKEDIKSSYDHKNLQDLSEGEKVKEKVNETIFVNNIENLEGEEDIYFRVEAYGGESAPLNNMKSVIGEDQYDDDPQYTQLVDDFEGELEIQDDGSYILPGIFAFKTHTAAWEYANNVAGGEIVAYKGNELYHGTHEPDTDNEEFLIEPIIRYRDKIINKSSLHPDNLKEIKSLNDSGIPGLVGGIHEEETFICKFDDKSQAIHKTMNMGDIAGEVGAYEISKMIGWDVVPETIQCDYGKGEGSSQKWIKDGKEPYSGYCDDCEIKLEEKHLSDLSKIFILDMINGNFDRHDGNIIIKDDRCWAIDNEMIGKRNNAEFHIDGLEQFAEKGSGSYLPMFGVLKNSFGDDIETYKKFKDHVDKNIDIALNKKDEIIRYWSQYKDSDYKNMDVPIKEGVKYVEKNIEYLKNYRSEK